MLIDILKLLCRSERHTCLLSLAFLQVLIFSPSTEKLEALRALSSMKTSNPFDSSLTGAWKRTLLVRSSLSSLLPSELHLQARLPPSRSISDLKIEERTVSTAGYLTKALPFRVKHHRFSLLSLWLRLTNGRWVIPMSNTATLGIPPGLGTIIIQGNITSSTIIMSGTGFCCTRRLCYQLEWHCYRVDEGGS